MVEVHTYDDDQLISIEELSDPPLAGVQPDWQGFMDRLHLPSEDNPGGTGLFHYYLLQINEVRAWQAYNMCLAFNRREGGDKEVDTLNFIYNYFAAVLPQQQRDILQQAIDDFNIPVELSPLG